MKNDVQFQVNSDEEFFEHILPTAENVETEHRLLEKSECEIENASSLDKSKLKKLNNHNRYESDNMIEHIFNEHKNIHQSKHNLNSAILANNQYLKKEIKNSTFNQHHKYNVNNQSQHLKKFVMGKIKTTTETILMPQLNPVIMLDNITKNLAPFQENRLSLFTDNKNIFQKTEINLEHKSDTNFTEYSDQDIFSKREGVYSSFKNNIKHSVIKEDNVIFKTAFKNYEELQEEIINNKKELKTIPQKEQDQRKLDKFKNIYDSFSEENDNTEDLENFYKSKYIINELSWFKKIWDIMMIFFVFFSITAEPYFLCFNISSRAINLLEYIMDVAFMIDLFINFFTPYYNKHKSVKNLRKIALNYLFGSFVFDLISSVPTSLIILGLEGQEFDSLNSVKSLMRITRLYKMLRWTRILRLARFAKKGSKTMKVDGIKMNDDSGKNRVLKFVLVFSVLIHVCSCAWIFLAMQIENGINWVTFYNFQDSSETEIYIASLYFNFVTILTIGYGDITARSITEKTYILFFLFVGIMVYSFAVSSLSNIFGKVNERERKLQNSLDAIEGIHKEYKLNKPFLQKIIKLVKFQHKKTNHDNYELLDTLPYSLKRAVIINMYNHELNKIKFFNKQNYDFIIFVIPLLKYMQMQHKEVLIDRGDFLHEMYIVLRGTLSIRIEEEYNGLEVARINQYYHFGEVLMYLNECCPYLLICRSSTAVLLTLSRADFTKIKMNFNPCVLQILKNSCQNLEVMEKSRTLIIELYNQGISFSYIKTKLNNLNNFLLTKNFDKLFKTDNVDVTDFILAHKLEDIIKFMNNEMSNNEFYECFMKEVNNNIPGLNISHHESDSTMLNNRKDSSNQKTLKTIREIEEDERHSFTSGLPRILNESIAKSTKMIRINNFLNNEKDRPFSKHSSVHDINDRIKMSLMSIDNSLLIDHRASFSPNTKKIKQNINMEIPPFQDKSYNFNLLKEFEEDFEEKPSKKLSKQYTKSKTGDYYPIVEKNKSQNLSFHDQKNEEKKEDSKWMAKSDLKASAQKVKIYNVYNYGNNYNNHFIMLPANGVNFTYTKNIQFKIPAAYNKNQNNERFNVHKMTLCREFSYSFTKQENHFLKKSKNSKSTIEFFQPNKNKFNLNTMDGTSIETNEKIDLTYKEDNSERNIRHSAKKTYTSLTPSKHTLTNLEIYKGQRNSLFCEKSTLLLNPQTSFFENLNTKSNKLINSNSTRVLPSLSDSDQKRKMSLFNKFSAAGPILNRRTSDVKTTLNDNFLNRLNDRMILHEIYEKDQTYLMNDIKNFLIKDKKNIKKNGVKGLKKLDSLLGLIKYFNNISKES